MNKKPAALLIGSMAILVIFLFYWTQYRPGEIRKDCAKVVREWATEADTKFSSSTANSRYRICLADHGLKPENLISE